ncbi:MAG: bacteriohemerythrin [candidate division Zixibacteria bacterium]|nr:bacteriohemerythrin [candidate division Zixibacteria bacterium]
MPTITWQEMFSVGVERIDSQHKELIRWINELEKSLKAEPTDEPVRSVLTSLISYTEYHFDSEEELMRLNDYPQYIRHKVAHDKLKLQVRSMQARFAKGDRVSANELLAFLSDWLVEHILSTDTLFGEKLRSRSGGLAT